MTVTTVTTVLAHLSRWSVEASQRGSVAFADQANACVHTSTTPLDPHERLGPAGATPGGVPTPLRSDGVPPTHWVAHQG